jgi:hypothetical protein
MAPALHDSLAELAAAAGVTLTAPAPADAGPAAGEPWNGYDGQTVKEITSRIAKLDDDERARVRAYEEAHKGRAGVVKAAKRSATG